LHALGLPRASLRVFASHFGEHLVSDGRRRGFNQCRTRSRQQPFFHEFSSPPVPLLTAAGGIRLATIAAFGLPQISPSTFEPLAAPLFGFGLSTSAIFPSPVDMRFKDQLRERQQLGPSSRIVVFNYVREC
jgi:hypothetical protein